MVDGGEAERNAVASRADTTTAAGTRRKRRPFRRDQILDAAVQLFHERGYHATGMDDIGAAAGITGPGIYRHFRNKEDILETAMQQAADQVMSKVAEVIKDSESPGQVLEGLVENFVVSLLAYPELSAVVLTERRVLPEPTQSLFDKAERSHLQEWVHALAALRPELSATEARFIVHSTAGLILSFTRYRTDLPRERVGELLAGMAMASMLGAPAAADVKKPAGARAASRARARQ
jgi:AcrR family transcriptional regulator